MATFDSTLQVVPTQVVQNSPVIIDNSANAIVGLATGITKGLFDNQARTDAAQLKANNDAVLAGVATRIQAVGASTQQAGGITQSQAKVAVSQIISKAITANPGLTKDIGQIAQANITSTGLGAGKSRAASEQETFLKVKQAMINDGFIPDNASDGVAKENMEDWSSLKDSNRVIEEKSSQLALINADVSLSEKQRDIKASRVKGDIVGVLKQTVMTNYDITNRRVADLMASTPNSPEGKTAAFTQLTAMEAQIRASIPKEVSALLSQEEIDNQLNGLLYPIKTARDMLDQNKPTDFIKQQIVGDQTLNDQSFYGDPTRSKIATWNRNAPGTVIGLHEQNFSAQEYFGEIANKKKKGNGSGDVSLKDQTVVTKQVTNLLGGPLVTPEDAETATTSLTNLLANGVTDNAQGKISKPSDIKHVLDMLASPGVNAKVVSGEMPIAQEDMDRYKLVVQDKYIDELQPAILSLMSKPREVGGGASIFTFEKTAGGVSVRLSDQAIADMKAAQAERDSQEVSPGRGGLPDAFLNSNKLEAVQKDFDAMKQLVANINVTAKAMATLSKQKDSGNITDSLMEGLLTSPNEIVNTPEFIAKQPLPAPDLKKGTLSDNVLAFLKKEAPPAKDTQSLLDKLSPDGKKAFNGLTETQQIGILSLSPDELKGVVAEIAPPVVERNSVAKDKRVDYDSLTEGQKQLVNAADSSQKSLLIDEFTKGVINGI